MSCSTFRPIASLFAVAVVVALWTQTLAMPATPVMPTSAALTLIA